MPDSKSVHGITPTEGIEEKKRDWKRDAWTIHMPFLCSLGPVQALPVHHWMCALHHDRPRLIQSVVVGGDRMLNVF